MASIFKQPKNKCNEKKSQITGGSVALLLGKFLAGMITIISLCGIVVAYKHTNELLECRQRLANSPEATENDQERANELQRSVWITTPKYVSAIGLALIGMLTFASLSTTLPVLFWKTWIRISTSRGG